MATPQRFPRNPEEDVIKLQIPPKDIKRLDDPHDDNRYAYECQIPATEATKLLIGSANPRKQDRGKPLSLQILETLQKEPATFHLRNRGIWVGAERAEYDNQKQTLTLICPQTGDERYGVVDGGHTKAMIDEFLEQAKDQSLPIKPMPFVMVHIRVGVEGELEKMVESLNRSAQLKEYALEDYKGEFDELKEIFSIQAFADDIGYTENESKEYDVLDVIQRLTLFCAGLYPNSGDAHPTIAYSSKAKCLSQFVKMKKHFLDMEPIMAACFQLPDQIEALLPEVSGSEKFGNFNFASKQKPKLRPSLKGVGTNGLIDTWKSGYNVSEAVIFPLAASLRVLVRYKKSDGSIAGWRQDPIKFFKNNGHELFDYVRRYYDEAGKSLSALGKKAEFWAKLHHSAYVALHPEE